MKLKFGTDGIRGLSQIELCPHLFYDIGAFLALRGGRPLMIARDTRESSFLYYNMFISGVISHGIDVYDLGITTTPVLAKSIGKTNAAFGVMITASHNPYRYNGIKVLSPNGEKIERNLEHEIEAALGFPYSRLIKTTRIGSVKDLSYLADIYADELLKDYKLLNIKKERLVFDCANGAGVYLLPKVIGGIGIENPIYVGTSPDGRNINEGVGSLYIDRLREMLKKEKCPLAFALDGDGDRLLIASKHRVYDGDILIALLYRGNKDLFKGGLVYTEESNYKVINLLKRKGVKLYQSEVGDKNVLAKMKEVGATLGYESSGHLLFNEGSCGLKSMMIFLKIFDADLKGMIRYANKLRLKAQERINFRVSDDEKFLKAYKGLAIEEKMIDQQKGLRIVLRKSGTENLFRLLIEGDNKKDVLRAKTIFTDFLESLKCAE